MKNIHFCFSVTPKEGNIFRSLIKSMVTFNAIIFSLHFLKSKVCMIYSALCANNFFLLFSFEVMKQMSGAVLKELRLYKCLLTGTFH